MLWSDRAFRIYFGNAGEGIDPALGDAATDAMASARTASVSDESCDGAAASSGGWLARIAAALANRAALGRTARS